MSQGRRTARLLTTSALVVSVGLAGCSTVGGCAGGITVAPRISVDVTRWVAAHPDTDVRVCVEGVCAAGSGDVVVTGQDRTTLPSDHSVEGVMIEPIRGSDVIESFSTTAPLAADQCGQWGAQLRLGADGDISSTHP